MSAAELARQLKVATNRVGFWLNLQSLYELRLAEQRAGRTIRSLPTLRRVVTPRK